MKDNHARNDEETPLVLIVEDDSDIRQYVMRGLRDQYAVEEAGNGPEGLRMALESIPDLIVTDIMMPGMNGMELCRELKTNELTSHIPVVMLTAKTSIDSQLQGLETGADDYVTKPFNMMLLKARINNLIETRRLLQMRYMNEFNAFDSDGFPDGDPDDEMLDLPGQGVDRMFSRKIFSVLRCRYADEDFSIDAFAEELGLSRRSLTRKIKALFGRTVLQLITEYRLKKAAKLLQNESISISDAALMTGFGDLSHFYRLFKKQYEKSPSQYRDDGIESDNR